jgi:hypothetical protein
MRFPLRLMSLSQPPFASCLTGFVRAFGGMLLYDLFGHIVSLMPQPLQFGNHDKQAGKFAMFIPCSFRQAYEIT